MGITNSGAVTLSATRPSGPAGDRHGLVANLKPESLTCPPVRPLQSGWKNQEHIFTFLSQDPAERLLPARVKELDAERSRGAVLLHARNRGLPQGFPMRLGLTYGCMMAAG
jgi:hypothetical protein